MNASITLAVLVTLIFALLGTAKILALPPMRELAAEAGFSVDAYRGIGVAGGRRRGRCRCSAWRCRCSAALAAAGLLLLLAGAVVTHLRATTTGRASTRPPSSAACSSPATSPR